MLIMNWRYYDMKKRRKNAVAPNPIPGFPNVLPAWSPLPGLKLGEAFVPPQRYSVTFSPDVALAKGTLFPELVSPYYG
jgi:hypothetical protein